MPTSDATTEREDERMVGYCGDQHIEVVKQQVETATLLREVSKTLAGVQAIASSHLVALDPHPLMAAQVAAVRDESRATVAAIHEMTTTLHHHGEKLVEHEGQFKTLAAGQTAAGEVRKWGMDRGTRIAVALIAGTVTVLCGLMTLMATLYSARHAAETVVSAATGQ